MDVPLVNMLGLMSNVYFAHIACYENSSFCSTHKSSLITGFTEQIMPISRILCSNGSLVTWTVVSLTTAKFKTLIFFTLSLSLILRPTVSGPVCLGIKHPFGASDQILITVRHLRVLLMWGVLSDRRAGLSFLIATGPRQRNHSRVQVSWDSRPYFTVSDSRLPFSSPPTTRRVTVEACPRHITPSHGPCRKHQFQEFLYCCSSTVAC
jgi:hypothetical protein